MSLWNQFAPRPYSGLVICLPFNGNEQDQVDATDHIRRSLDRLARARPDFAARLQVAENGFVEMHRSPDASIPLDVIYFNPETSRDIHYAHHKKNSFPPALFNSAAFAQPCIADKGSPKLPVAKVELEFIRGGLYLMMYLCHSMFDGSSFGVFIDMFAEHTRTSDEDIAKLPQHRPANLFPGPVLATHACDASSWSTEALKLTLHRDILFDEALKACPEWGRLDNKSGPTQPSMQHGGVAMSEIPRIGKIFVFRNSKLDELREKLRVELGFTKPPSSYMAMTTLAWAHIIKARMTHEAGFLPDTAYNAQRNEKACLSNIVNFRSRIHRQVPKDYIGNSTIPVLTELPIADVLAACDSLTDLARLVPHIMQSIDNIDENHIEKREFMFHLAPDPRMVGRSHDLREPSRLSSNTWRHFGMDAEWSIPGLPEGMMKADAIRRVSDGWALGNSLIMPAAKGAEVQEMLVSMSVEAMTALEEDEGWLEWVDKVVG